MSDNKKRYNAPVDIDVEVRSSAARTVLLGIVMLLLLVFTGYQFYALCDSRQNMQIQNAVYQTLSKYATAEAFIIREEHYVENSHSGTVVPSVSNGSKVAIGDTVARIFPTENDARNASRLESLKENIDYYHSVSVANTGMLPADIDLYRENVSAILGKISDSVSNNELDSLSGLSAEFRKAITKKQIACGGTVDVLQKLSSLQSEYSALESSISSYYTVTSEVSGYYINSSDGYENVIDFSSVKDIGYEDVEALCDAEPAAVPSDTVGKLVTEFNWYLVCNVDEKEVRDIKEESTVKVSFPNAFVRDLNMNVCRVVSGEHSGYVTLILSSNKMDESVAALRKETVKIKTAEYSGFPIETRAVRTVNGEKGVYVRVGNGIKFKKISDIVYSDENIVLATSKSGNDNYLGQYDEIILEGTGLYDGKNIG